MCNQRKFLIWNIIILNREDCIVVGVLIITAFNFIVILKYDQLIAVQSDGWNNERWQYMESFIFIFL